MGWYDDPERENKYVIDIALRHTAYVPYDIDADEWVKEHKEEVLRAMRGYLDDLETGKAKIRFADNWGDLKDYEIY